MEIKQLTSKNIQDILDLEKENAPRKPFYVAYTKEELDGLYKEGKFFAFGLYDGEELIEWGSYEEKSPNEFEISSLVLNKRNRGKGLGKKMINYLIDEIHSSQPASQPASNIHLVVYPKNLPALLLYLNCGFVIYGYKKDYFGPGTDRLLLKLS